MAPHGLTHAQPARGVQRQALGTLAAEGAGSVEALPIGTDPGEDLALVHIWAGTEKEERQGLELLPWGSRTPRLPLQRWGGTASASGAGESQGKTQVPRRGNLCLDLKRLQDRRHPP